MTTQAVFEDVVIRTNLRILHISFMFVKYCGKVCSGGGSLAILLMVNERSEEIVSEERNVLSCLY